MARRRALIGFLSANRLIDAGSEPALQHQLFTADNQDSGIPRIKALQQDASTRRYYRLETERRRLIVMDAPPGAEDPEAFIRTTGYLALLEARVPELIATDPDQGFLVLEDLGDQTFTRLLEGGAEQGLLYRAAVDELKQIQAGYPARAGQIVLPTYDLDAVLREVGLLIDWYLPARLGRPIDQAERETFYAIWTDLFQRRPGPAPVMVHRDYHVDNLLMVDGRCAMLDYQDALLGSPLYDLVSLLEDARRDVDGALRQSILQDWCRNQALSPADFEHEYCFWGAQRHCKVAGIFTRLWLRDHKEQYLPHLPRVLGLLQQNLQHETLAPLREWLGQLVPAVSHVEPVMDAAALRQMLATD